MNTKQLVVSSMIAASLAAFSFTSQAAGPSSQAGEAYHAFVMPSATSATSRATVQAGVFEARARGELVAGQATSRSAYAYGGESTLARAEVREAVLDARRHGELVAQGELIAPAMAQHSARPGLFAGYARR